MQLSRDTDRPIQFIFAGKAHPRDDDGKRYIQHIIHLSKYSDLQGHLVFIENYDVHVARQMVSGCDVWLNNPRRPLEASGTSGMKAGCHGCLNLSILDGWWREGYDGTNGFAIGEDSHPDSVEEQDRLDSGNLYQVLTQEVIPLFYERDAKGIPRQWIGMIRRAMVTLVPQFTTWRMVQEYTRTLLPSAGLTTGSGFWSAPTVEAEWGRPRTTIRTCPQRRGTPKFSCWPGSSCRNVVHAALRW